MRLKYIEIQGFKSFPDRTRIVFDDTYTAIVGPNGSGKSNISDAVRWVLGEQSNKSLRSGKMEDIIFGGTQLRKPMGFAQVSLCLDNTDGRLVDAGDEIVIARRYYRSGDSEYLINGSTVRLRDVREMFMDTGLGRDGYSIIGQGRIAEIVSAKSDERREIFEEASGIAKYRFRKNEAGRKLDAAEDNLSRLRDILEELETRIEPLSHQSTKAIKFLEFSNEKKSLEITLYCDTIERSRESMRTQNERIAAAVSDYNEVEVKLLSINEQIEKMSDQNRKHNADIDSYNADIIQTGEQAARIESEIAVIRNDIKHAEEQISLLVAERDGLSSDGSGIVAEVGARRQAMAEKEAELKELEQLIADAETELTILIENSEQSDQKRTETAKKLTELQTEATDLRVVNVAASSSVEALNSRLIVVDEQILALDIKLADTKKELAENREYYNRLVADTEARNNQIRGFDIKHDCRKQKLTALSGELEKQDYEIQDLTHKAKVLSDMDKNLDGFSPGVRRVIEASDNRQLRGIIGTVASLISIRSGNEVAIETALGATAQNIVVTDERAAKQGIQYLKESKSGRATFLPLDTVKPSSFDATEHLGDDGILGLASELVSCDSRYSEAISSLLGRIVVADNLDSASAAAKKMDYRYRVVTLDGQIINAGGSYTGGYTARQGGLFTRKNEIEKLENRVVALRQATESTRAEHAEIAKEVSDLEAELTALRSDQITGNEDRIRAEAVISRLEDDIETAEDQLNDAQAEIAVIAQSQAEKNLIISENDGKIAKLETEVARLEQAAGDESQSGDEFMERRSRLTAFVGEHKILRAEAQKDFEGIEQAIEVLTRQGDVAEDRAAGIAAAIARVTAENAERRARVDGSTAQVEAFRGAAAQRRADIENLVKARTDIERDVIQIQTSYGEIAKQREDVGREISRLEERKLALQSDYDIAIARLWEEYELTRPEAEKFRVPFDNLTELRQQVGSLRSRIKALGSVNVGAIEELKEVTERYTFLLEQVSDVEKSKAELIKLIAQLESEMTVIFSRNFTEINSRFRTVFVELFGGGSANLSLTDESDVLESGIDIDVQPPGKVIKNLASLSGGEQALVAIALYFSILAVNPSPFCILDEIDSALDEANVNRFAAYLRRVIAKTQIIAITHRRGTMEAADILYGVTMQEEGVSKILKLGIEEAELVISK